MSLLEQYKASKGLQGFTLGFKTFFESFTLTHHVSDNRYSYKWNDVILSRGATVFVECQYEVPPCECPNPLGQYGKGYGILKCPQCGHQGVMGDIKHKYYSFHQGIDSIVGPAQYLDELREFAYEQGKWIVEDNTQKLYKTNKRQLKEECQRRINFFVQALHTHLAGKPNLHTARGTVDPFLRDIRNLANLCLKE